MNSTLSLLRTWVLLLGLLQIARSEIRLEQVQVLFRHGERTPRVEELYPNDPYNVSVYEPMGLGQLTNEGKMTEYRIGKMLRQRYNNFLGDIYRPGDIHAVSSDVDRTKMSLLLTLAGLYPPNPSQTWNSKLWWMPIPIHYTPEIADLLFKPHLNPEYIKVMKEVKNSEQVRKKLATFKDFFEFLSTKTGLDIKDTSQVFEIFLLLTSQKSMNLTMPDWCTEEVYKKMETATAFDYELRSYTTELKRLNGGMFIKKFIQNMNLTGEKEHTYKIHLYGGHEVNIAAVAKAHNLSEPKIPDFGSAILIEKFRNKKTGQIFVQMLLWSGRSSELSLYKLDKCDMFCPIEQYLKIVKDVLPTEENLEAQWSHITTSDLRKFYENNM